MPFLKALILSELTDDVEVYKCEKKTCGLFYHEQCLSMYDNVTLSRIDTMVERLNGEINLDNEDQDFYRAQYDQENARFPSPLQKIDRKSTRLNSSH